MIDAQAKTIRAQARLAEHTRITQVALEAHRSSPDDVSWLDFQRAQAARDLEWANHQDRNR